jgi:hypothetical protein
MVGKFPTNGNGEERIMRKILTVYYGIIKIMLWKFSKKRGIGRW